MPVSGNGFRRESFTQRVEKTKRRRDGKIDCALRHLGVRFGQPSPPYAQQAHGTLQRFDGASLHHYGDAIDDVVRVLGPRDA
jgi:hypothetical protein